MSAANFPRIFPVKGLLGNMKELPRASLLPEGVWYEAQQIGDGLEFDCPSASLEGAAYLTADLLVDGNHSVVFVLSLGETERRFGLHFSALNQCQARIRLPLEAVKQNRWGYDREGAWLKPRCTGDRVDLDKVERITLTITAKSDAPARFCLTPLVAVTVEPELLEKPLLPSGPLLDEFGQSTLHEWPAKTHRESELVDRLTVQLDAAPSQRFPDGFSPWGGSESIRFEASGFFRTHHDGRRWWLVDPDGCAFWSAGMDCVRVNTDAMCGGLETALSWRPDPKGDYQDIYLNPFGHLPHINYLAANFRRTFGPSWYDCWGKIALAELRRLGFNTVANWSDWRLAKEAGFPYVRPLDDTFSDTPTVFRDFPDVFHPDFARHADAYARQLVETKDDPAFLGYFLMNEPTWGFASETPAVGMLYNTPACATRRELAEFLRKKYSTDAALAAAWNLPVTFAQVAEGEWRGRLSQPAEADLEAFSTVMVAVLFSTLNEACQKVDPNHLNLGMRYYTVPPRWALDGMEGGFDVFSVNGYQQRVRPELEELSSLLNRPVMVGEWHFGALDVGLPASGIGHVRDQHARGQAYRVYLEDAAAKPWCVGVHWFTLYDESALGRFDGENWNIGFLDVCNRPYEPICQAAQASHARLYQVAQGDAAPYDEAPEYLPLLFF